MGKIPNAINTLGPLHFEDLEPHRFEDLVRQLVYDFRNWGSLEPTGRLGSDDGYDARGTEIVEGISTPADGEDDGDDGSRAGSQERLWQIQCKRERSITPKKIAGYVDEMIPRGGDTPYGVIFAAPTDFSKRARDIFRANLNQKGVREFYLWGRADIEDVLFQPKNDHLLYAYFGISLQIQKRSQRSALRSILAIKKKAISHLGPIDQRSFKDVLIRDIDDNRYPHPELIRDFHHNPAWKMFHFVGHTHDAIRLLIRRYFAYRDVEYLPPDGAANLKAWDFTRKGEMRPEDPWGENDAGASHAVYQFWQGLDKGKQAFFEIVGRIRYENIIDIDPTGDIYAGCPHIYVKRAIISSFFEKELSYKLVPSDSLGWGRETYLPANAEELRQQIFPEKFPEPPQ